MASSLGGAPSPLVLGGCCVGRDATRIQNQEAKTGAGMATKSTSPKIAVKASKLLTSKTSGASSKSVAGSALSQAGTKKTTSKSEASVASKVLLDKRTSKTAKSVAGSVLAQRSAPAKKAAMKKSSSSMSGGTGSGGPRMGSK